MEAVAASQTAFAPLLVGKAAAVVKQASRVVISTCVAVAASEAG